MTTDSPEGLDTAIGSPAFEAAKEAAQARGWVMEPSVISAMLAAAVPFIREAIAAEIEAAHQPYDLDSPALAMRVVYESGLSAAARIASGVSGE